MALTASSDYFTGIRNDVTKLALDFARAKLIDVERDTDDRNIPDRADLKNGETAASSADGLVPAPGGITLEGWFVLGVFIVAGAWLVKRVF